MDFASAVNRRCGEYAAPRILGAFVRLGLPLPGEGEFADSQQGFLVFLSDYGVLLRVETEDVERFSHPAILQPIGTIECGSYRVEICPGVRPGVTPGDSEKLGALLAKDGLGFFDAADVGGRDVNCGYLPVMTREFPHGLPVVIDPPSVDREIDYDMPKPSLMPAFLKKILKIDDAPKTDEERWYYASDNPYAFVQRQIYGPLVHKFNDAWPNRSAPPDREKLSGFWALCRRYAEPGETLPPPLQATWAAGEFHARGMQAAASAAKYAEKLRQNPPESKLER